MADRKIDVHAHFVPDFYRKALLDHGISNPDGMPGVPEWSVEGHLEFMQVGTLFISLCYFVLADCRGSGVCYVVGSCSQFTMTIMGNW